MSSDPVMQRPRSEEAFSLDHAKRGRLEALFVPALSLSRMDVGTPRGKETTTGSWLGLFSVTSTQIVVVLCVA